MRDHHPITVRRSRSRRARWSALGAALALSAAVTACGSSDSDASSTTTSPPSATTTSTVAAPGMDNTVTVSAPGMSYDVSGDLHPGVATIHFQNDDDVTHMLGMARLKDGVTIDEVRAALDKGEEEAGKLLADRPEEAVYGVPAAVGPGQSSTATMVDLPEGHYVLLCFFTDDDHVPHWKMGMIAELTVTGTEATAVPTSDGTIGIDDDGITLPKGFDGHGTFEVENSGSKDHSISFAKLDEGTTLDDYYQEVGRAQSTQVSMDVDGGVLVGGIDDLLPGQKAYLTIDLPQGHYGYVSTADAQGPEMPAQHGEIDIN
jgi:hypothetical protein